MKVRENERGAPREIRQGAAVSCRGVRCGGDLDVFAR